MPTPPLVLHHISYCSFLSFPSQYPKRKPGQSELEFRKAMGYLLIEDAQGGSRLEEESAFYARMEGAVRLYATIIQTPSSMLTSSPPSFLPSLPSRLCLLRAVLTFHPLSPSFVQMDLTLMDWHTDGRGLLASPTCPRSTLLSLSYVYFWRYAFLFFFYY